MVQYLRDDYPEIAELVDVSKYSIYETGLGKGSVKYLGKDFKGEDGFSPFYIIGDEYHAWRDDGLMHVMESGLIKRNTSLTFIITTEGDNPDGPFAQMKKRCKQMLQGDAENDQMFALLYELDEGDDWQDRRNWAKANPGLGVTVSLESIEAEYQKARAEGVVKENNFKTKNLNIPVAGSVTWIPDELWAKAGRPFNASDLHGRLCFGGLDFSRNRDLTAWVLFFPPLPGETTAYCLCRFYLPETTARDRNRLDGIPFLQWAADGHLTVIPGDLIRPDIVEKQILDDYHTYDLHSIAYDRHLITQMVAGINDQIGPVPHTQTKTLLEGFAQTIPMFTAPLLELERMIVEKRLNHGQNPILRWNNRNIVLMTNANDGFKLDKKKSADKIDGMVALAMSVGQYMTYQHTLQQESGIIVL